MPGEPDERGGEHGVVTVAETDPIPLPKRVQVEVTGACNLRCRMCLVGHRPPLAVRGATMSLDRLRALLDDLPELEELTLQGLGEPLLAPELFAMIAEIKRRGVRVGFNTNATLLTVERAERLVDLQLDWLHVSVDGATPETFASIRVGGRLDVVVQHLSDLVRIRSERRRPSPRIQLNTVLMHRNLAELDALVELAASIGVDRMWVQRLSHDMEDVRGDPAYDAILAVTADEMLADAEIRPVLERAATTARRLGLDLRLPSTSSAEVTVPAGRQRCDWPWSGAYVTHEGRVQPCCMVMGSDRVTLGHLDQQSFAAIWRSPPYESFRRRLSSDEPPSVCAGCSVYHGRF
jgi:radical SAM protein with 4Fe4S-binding SPASM domain